MASEIRVDKINSLSGVGTVTLSPTGVDIAGITTAATLRATTGIVTSLTAGSLTSLGAVSGTTGTFSAAVSGTTGTFSGAVSGTTGTFTGDVDIADKIIHTGDTNTAIRFPEADTITFEANGFEQVRIDNDVQMFVEANSKQAKLQLHREDVSIDADDVVGQITFTGRDAGGAGIQRVGAAISAIASNNWDTTQSSGYSATHLDFYTQAQQSAYSTLTPRVRIDSSGRVLIGTTNVGGGNADDLTVENPAGGNTGITIRSGTSNTGNIFWSDATSGADQYVGALEYHHSDNQFKFNIANTTRMTVDSTGDVTVSDGDLVIGTSGHGIDFSATANSSGSTDNELFDDYEEGLFTPILSAASGSSTVTYQGSDNRRGRYVKIGKMVHVNYLVGWNDITSGFSGDMHLGGLPFAHENVEHADPNDYTQSVGACYFQNLTIPNGNNGHTVVYIWGGYSTYAVLMQSQNNGNLQVVQIDAGNNSSSSTIKYVQFSLTYPAA